MTRRISGAAGPVASDPCLGAPVGGFFYFPPGAEHACRWNPLQTGADGQTVGAWVPWPLSDAPEEQPPWLRRLLIELGLAGDDPADDAGGGGASAGDGDENQADDTKDHESAAKAAADSAQKAVDRHREAVKWFVATAGAIAAAVIGTAPLAGLPTAVARDFWGLATWGFLLTVGALITILLLVAWTIQPVEKSTAELAYSKKGLFSWRRNLQKKYEEDSDLFLDGRAATLQNFKLYRAAWRGTEADIDRQLLREADPARHARLTKYLAAAKERIARDDDSVSATLARGAVYQAAARGWLAISVSALASAVAAIGFLVYLSGTVATTLPIITSLSPTPEEPKLGQTVTLAVVASGEGLDYVWTHDGIQIEENEKFSGTETRRLVILDFNDEDAGLYRVTVTDAEDALAFDEVDLAEPEKPAPPDSGLRASVGAPDAASAAGDLGVGR